MRSKYMVGYVSDISVKVIKEEQISCLSLRFERYTTTFFKMATLELWHAQMWQSDDMGLALNFS